MERRFRILVVDDEQINIRIVLSALRDEYEVSTAADGQEAIERLRENTPDLILLDVMMPGVNGFEACAIIKKDERYADIPVIFLTAMDTAEGELQGLQAGGIDYITKPINFELLRMRLRNHLTMKVQRDLLARQKEELARALAEQGVQNRLLAESEARHRVVIEAAMDGFIRADLHGCLLEVNQSYCRMSGYSEAELLGMRICDLEAQEPPGEFGRHSRFIMERGQDRFESRHRRRDGSAFDVEVSCHFQEMDGGQIISFVRDITERKRSDNCRNMGREILLMLNGPEELQVIMGRVVAALREVTGVDAVGVRLQEGEDFPFLCHDGFCQEFLLRENSLLNRDRQNGVCRAADGSVSLECACGMVIGERVDPANPCFTASGSFWTNDSFQFRELPAELDARIHRNECIHQGYASVALIPIRAKGRVIGLLQLNAIRRGAFILQEIEALEGIAENLGEAILRKQAEELLVSRERFLRTLTDNLPGMVAYCTDDLRCTFANRAYREWFGRSPEELAGIPVRDIFGEEFYTRVEPHLQGALRGEPQHFQRTQVKPDGNLCYTWAHYVPDVVDGAVRGFFVLISDVTELKLAEEEKGRLQAQLQQAQKMESVGRLAGGVAHDFNNFLTVILGYAELGLHELDRTHHFYPRLEEILRAAEKSADLTQQLLAFARKQTVAPKVLDLNEAVENVLKMLRRLIGEDIHLAWQPAGGLWKTKVDPSQIDQILANLCVNARDAIADTGKITIETSNCTLDSEYCSRHFGFAAGNYVMLAVSDDGCGMDREIINHVFEPFFTTKGIGQGTGLGLATVYGIVKQNQGFINVYSEPGQGTTFRIYLPRHDAAPDQPAESKLGRQLTGGNETILLVEDEASILNLTALMLQKHGYRVLPAGGPEEALEIAERHGKEISLVITDVVMPGMNGRDLARRLQSLCPDIRCLYMSGYTANVIAHHGVLDEGVNFLSKPFSLPDLTVKVREVLDC